MSMPWYGELPERWEARRIKNLFILRDERNFKPLSDVRLLSLYTAIGVKPHDEIERIAGNVAVTANNYKKVYIGDIVVNIILCWQGAIGLSKWDGVTSPAYDVYRAKSEDVNVDYFNYLFRTPLFSGECYKAGRGIMAMRWRTYSNEFTAINAPLPPRDEQDQIVRYLDWKVSGINRLINTKRRQITLLQEKIDVLTNQAITKIENKMRLKMFVDVIREWIVREDNKLYSPAGVLNRGRGVFHKEQLIGADLGDSDFFKLEKDSLMISGQFAWEGAVALTTENENDCIASHRYYTIKGKNRICQTEYLWAFFQTTLGDLILNKCSHGAAGRNKPLNFKELLNEYISLPTLETQDIISKNVRLLMALRKKVKLYEQLLNEYRTRLISDVVTGKLNVRGVVVPEYEAVDDLAADEEIEDMEGMEA